MMLYNCMRHGLLLVMMCRQVMLMQLGPRMIQPRLLYLTLRVHLALRRLSRLGLLLLVFIGLCLL